jgi:hypothetical protein
MKKLLSVILISGMFAIVACGPSAQEKADAEKRMQDSIAQVAADSMKKAMEDSMAMAQKMMQDSISAANMKAMQDSMAMIQAKMNKPAPKPKSNKQKMEEDKKTLQKQKG